MFRIVAAIVLLCCSALHAGPPRTGKATASRPARVKITISRETTYVTGPLNADGTVNYVAVVNRMYGKGVTPTNNAAVGVIKALGPEALDAKVRRRALKLLKIGTLPRRGRYFIMPWAYGQRVHPEDHTKANEVVERLSRSIETARKEMIRPSDHPDLVRWLDANAEPLAKLKAASKKPRFFVPWVSQSDPPATMDVLLTFRAHVLAKAVKALCARALLRASRGDNDGAVSDLLVSHRLGRLLGQRPALIDFLVSTRVRTMASTCDQALATSGKLTAGQAAGYLKALRGLPAPQPPAEALDRGERLFSLDTIMGYAHQGLNASLPAGEPQLPDVAVNWNVLLKLQNEHHDRIVAAMRTGTLLARKQALERLRKDILRSAKPGIFGRSGNILPWALRGHLLQVIEKTGADDPDKLARAIDRIFNAAGTDGLRMFLVVDMRAHAHRNLAVLALALTACHGETSRFPQALGALAPKYIERVPKDPFTDKPLKYRRRGNGYLLYSVGENLKDDGGRGTTDDRDDIVVKAN